MNYFLKSFEACYCCLFPAARTLSYKLASEVVLVLELVVTSMHKFLDKSVNGNGKGIGTGSTREVLHFVSKRLGASAKKLLFQKCDDIIDKDSKPKVHNTAHSLL